MSADLFLDGLLSAYERAYLRLRAYLLTLPEGPQREKALAESERMARLGLEKIAALRGSHWHKRAPHAISEYVKTLEDIDAKAVRAFALYLEYIPHWLGDFVIDEKPLA